MGIDSRDSIESIDNIYSINISDSIDSIDTDMEKQHKYSTSILTLKCTNATHYAQQENSFGVFLNIFMSL